MAEKFDVSNSLSKEELEMKKLQMEVSLLQKQYDELKHLGIFARLYNYLQKNVGQILAILVLFGGFVSPALSYISDFKKKQTITLNNDILRLFEKADSLHTITPAMLRNLSIQDPAKLAPFMLDQFNDGKLDSSFVKPVFERMFEVNSHADDRNIWDKFLFLFIRDNKEILEDELCSHADSAFNQPVPHGTSKLFPIWKTYVEIIYDEHLLLLEPKQFTDALNIPRQKDKKDHKNYDIIMPVINSGE